MGLPENIRSTIDSLINNNDFRSVAELIAVTDDGVFGGYSGSFPQGTGRPFNCISTRLQEIAELEPTGDIITADLTLVVEYDQVITEGYIVRLNSLNYDVRRTREIYLGNTTGAATDNKKVVQIVELTRRLN